ncbi:hypothetical protein H5410_001164, partial [Solanum commersonii]
TSGEDEDGTLKTLKAAAFQEKIEMKLEKSEVSIPHEIIFEIFSWLPVKSLMHFKCVSGLCNSLIFESDFLHIHRCCSSRTNFLLHDGIFFYAADLKEDENISASLLLTERLHTYSGLNCANSLLCVWEQYNGQPALILNPSTREVRFLPDPNKGRSCGNYLIGFEPQENTYKMNPSISEEILIEIFLWLPVKSLMHFNCVTKFFNSLISESIFFDTHRCRSVTHPGGTKFIFQASEIYCTSVQLKEHEKTSIQIQSFDAIPFNIPHLSWSRLNCVNGLFCIWETLSNQPATILNPSTREVRFLPSLNADFLLCYYSFGFEPEEKKYKIITTTNHVRGSYIKRWVFTLGIDESWRKVNSSLHNVFWIPEVYINGVIYKFAFHNEFAIAGFDVKSEIS